jgi:hypothetical protein
MKALPKGILRHLWFLLLTTSAESRLMSLFCTSAQVAQSVEQRTENPRVDGSIPPLGTIQKVWLRHTPFIFAQVAQSVEQRTENPRVDGSIPPLGTMLFSCYLSRTSFHIHKK